MERSSTGTGRPGGWGKLNKSHAGQTTGAGKPTYVVEEDCEE
jgi:hypothetical protein